MVVVQSPVTGRPTFFVDSDPKSQSVTAGTRSTLSELLLTLRAPRAQPEEQLPLMSK